MERATRLAQGRLAMKRTLNLSTASFVRKKLRRNTDKPKAPSKSEDMIYVDCFIDSDRKFPVNSYGPLTDEDARECAAAVFNNPNSGIAAVEFNKECKGCSPTTRWRSK